MHVLPAALLQVLLFCTMTRALDVVEDYLSWRGFPALRLDGNTGAAERGELVRRFNDPGGFGGVGTCDVFVIPWRWACSLVHSTCTSAPADR